MLTDKFKSMFREYDIRGRLTPDELNIETCALIIRGFATFLVRRGLVRCALGYDNRKDSPAFAEVAARELAAAGIEVRHIGLAVSPALYFAQHHLRCEAGVMVTASHNPDGWLGFKLAHGYSKTLGPAEIKELYAIIEKGDFAKGVGSIIPTRIREAYLEAIVSRVKLNPARRPMRIAIDSGNGAAGPFAWELFQMLGCMTFQLYCDPDDSYPQYFPNPSDLKARKRLKEIVTHPYIAAEIGLAFDGDGDRIGVLDENGENVWSDKVLILLAKGLLERTPGARIVFDVKCTKALPEEVTRLGGVPVMCKTGHSYVKAKLHETGAELGGERSGHIFYADGWYGFDDALYTAAKLLEYLSHQEGAVSKVLAGLPQYVTSPEIKTHCDDAVKYRIVDEITQAFKAEYGDRVIDINGARVEFDDGWGLVRASSNLPELVLIFEGTTENSMRRIRSIFRGKLDAFAEIDKAWENDID